MAVKPFPILQIINLVFGIFMFAWEWPLGLIAGSALHRSIEARLVFLPMTALAAALLYQATNPALYYTIGMVVYFWAYSEGEVRLFSSPSSREGLLDDLLMGNRLWWRNRGRFLAAPLARFRCDASRQEKGNFDEERLMRGIQIESEHHLGVASATAFSGIQVLVGWESGHERRRRRRSMSRAVLWMDEPDGGSGWAG